MFASATGRSAVVSAASERYMREEPLFVGEGGNGQGLPDNIRHTIVTVPKVRYIIYRDIYIIYITYIYVPTMVYFNSSFCKF